MSLPKVSVIIPVYNVEPYLKECLDSVVNQTLKEIEIICVDDGSTDNSLHILKEYAKADKRFKILEQKNQFAGVARNTGMQAASGEYYVFLDSDDFFEPDLLEKQYEQCKKTNADVCVCGANKFDHLSKEYLNAPHWLQIQYCNEAEVFSSWDLGDKIFSFTGSQPWNKMFSAPFIKESRLLFQALRSANDLYFVYSALVLAERITYVNSELVHYRTGLTTNIQSNKAKKPDDFCEALLALKNTLVSVHEWPRFEKAFVNLALEHCEWNLSTLKEINMDAHSRLARQIKEKYIFDFDIAGRTKDYFNNTKKYDTFYASISPIKIPKITLALAVYNVEKYLRECLESIVHQSFQNIEIICVNDGSTDNSGNILDEYASKDKRIKVLHKSQNEGLMLARKSAVEMATGEYLLFIDSDDFVKPDLCSFVYDITSQEDVDIIQYKIQVKDYSNDTQKAAWLTNALTPIPRELHGIDILREAYVTRSYTTSLLGKIYKMHLCKKAYSKLPNVHCFVGEDIFSYFFIAYYAKTYKGIESDGYYIYRYGLGVGNSDMMPLSKFELYCKMANWVRYVHLKLVSNDNSDEVAQSYYAMGKRMSEDCCKIYRTRIQEENMDDALAILCSYWKNIPAAEDVARQQLGISLKEKLAESIPIYEKLATAYNDDTCPKVSVIIPVYDVENYLDECITSVLNQTLKEVEIVCVNDGSLDHSLEILEKYAQADRRLTIISRENGGASKARNIGMKYAHGEFIYFLDSDDLIVPNALENLYACAKKNNSDLIYFGAESFFENRELKKMHANYSGYYDRKKLFDEPVSGIIMFKELLNRNLFRCSVPLQFIRKELLNNTGLLFKEGITHEDELFSPLLLVKAQRVLCIQENLYLRRVRDNSVMTSNITGKKFAALFIVYATLQAIAIADSTLSLDAKELLISYAKKMYDSAKGIYKRLKWDEIAKIPNLLPPEYQYLYKELRPSLDWTSQKSLESFDNEYSSGKEFFDIKNSLSYKVGRMITYIPRKVRGGILCIRDHGVIYTLKLACQKVIRGVGHIAKKLRGGVQCCKDHGISYTIKYSFKKIFR